MTELSTSYLSGQVPTLFVALEDILNSYPASKVSN